MSRYFHKKKWDRNRDDEGTSSSHKGGRPKRPEGLKGRDIGMWYAAQSKLKREQNQANYEPKPLGSVILSDSKKENIERLLNETSSLYPKLTNTDSYQHMEESDFKHEFLEHIQGSIIEKLKSNNKTYDFKNEALDKQYHSELTYKKSLVGYQQMQETRKRLPSMKMKEQILDLINSNQIVVISGETGCGKTTQVAQFILDDYIEKGKGSECKVICTQPRRISAISVAERVAQERDEKLGVSAGYQIRLEKMMPRSRGSLLYCTTGVLLKFMESDPALSEVSHLILDEIHERDVTSDFLICVLKDVIKYRKDLKIILMSATLNAEAFSKYYHNAPHINIPGFTYPVKEYFLEDVLQMTKYRPQGEKRKRYYGTNKEENDGYIQPYLRQLEAEKKYDREVINALRQPNCEKLNSDLIYHVIKYVFQKEKEDDGAILVFVPGFLEIQNLIKAIRESPHDFPPSKYNVIPLHSQLPTVDQKQIFKPSPKGIRKIIIATNIAETSITIEDVTIVIDSGYIKMSNLDPDTGVETLKSVWVSCANAAQRKGRAGRVKAGKCYHLFTRIRHELLEKFQKPEVLRRRLEDVVLQLKLLQLGEAKSFLSKLMDPPDPPRVVDAINILYRLGALDKNESLTPLGLHMAKLPIGAKCAKMLIMAAMFSCLDPVLSVAASLDFKDAFQLSATDKRGPDRVKLELAQGQNSDHLLMHFALKGFEESSNQWAFCRRYFLSYQTLKLLIDMRRQFANLLHDMKFIKDPNPKSSWNNYNSDNLSLVKAVICSGLYPNVAHIKAIRREPILRSFNDEKMSFHPKSILSSLRSIPSPLVVYHIRLKSMSILVHDATLVFPLPVVFFGDEFKRLTTEKFNGITLNEGKMRFICTESTASLIDRLRTRLNQILEYKVSHPGFVDWSEDSPEVKILRVIMVLITSEDTEEMDLSDFDDC